jgi:hypothetical protein
MQLPLTLAGRLRTTFADVVSSPLPGRVAALVSRLIAICMFIGAITMIGLALTGALQMRVAHSPVVAIVSQ